VNTQVRKTLDDWNLLGHQFEFIALPLKISGADGSPVRAIAILQ
jgi:kynurenine formamidase